MGRRLLTVTSDCRVNPVTGYRFTTGASSRLPRRHPVRRRLRLTAISGMGMIGMRQQHSSSGRHFAMPKAADVSARMDPELKLDAEKVFAEPGLTATEAITLF